MSSDCLASAKLRGEISVPVGPAQISGITHSSNGDPWRRPDVPQQQQPDLRIPNHSPGWGFRSEPRDSE